MPKMPKRFEFLALEPSKFPLEVAIRMFLKIVFAVTLQIENSKAQLIIFLVFNFVNLLYYFIFKPSLYKFTNRLNIFLCLCFMGLEAVLFAYSITTMTLEEQNTYSILALVVTGLILVVIFIWMIYRFIIFMREKCC